MRCRVLNGKAGRKRRQVVGKCAVEAVVERNEPERGLRNVGSGYPRTEMVLAVCEERA